MGIIKRIWNAFSNKDPTEEYKMTHSGSLGVATSYRPDRTRRFVSNERSIVTSIYNRIALDVASIDIEHVRVDKNGNYLDTIESEFNARLTLSSNIDQTSHAFKIDLIMSMFDEGCVAIVPYEATANPRKTVSYDILAMRVGKPVAWFPQSVTVEMYNDQTGATEQLTVPKRCCALIENPLYAVMNEPNSILQRLIRKLNLLDVIDEQSGSGKLDLIIQLPYVIKSDARKAQAEHRRQQIEEQLANSKYGIAYTDGTERITQLNRAVENNLMSQIEYLTNMLYGQLGMDKTIFDGTADEQTMLNYYNRTIEPILTAVTLEMKRKFLSKTARSQGQSVKFFRDPFKLVPASQLADLADRFTRNEIMSSNEFRSVIGYKPSKDPRADQLVNKNISQNQVEETSDEAAEEYDVDSELSKLEEDLQLEEGGE